MFVIVGFLAQKILGIVGLQIKTKKIFFWLKFLLTLRDVVCKQKNLKS
jgi:hypothetical protein